LNLSLRKYYKLEEINVKKKIKLATRYCMFFEEKTALIQIKVFSKMELIRCKLIFFLKMIKLG